MKKVLYISPNGFMGGAERFVYNTALAHSDNIEPIYIFFSEGRCSDGVRSLGKEVYILPHRLRLSRPISVLKTVAYIRNIIVKNDIDIIHSTMPYAQLIAWLSCLFLSVRKVWFQHGPVGGLLDKLASFTSVDQVYFNSKYLQSVHNRTWPAFIDKEKQFLVNYGNEVQEVDTSNVESIRKKYLENHTYLIGCIGRICDWKGYLNVLKAIDVLRNQYSYKLLIVGSANSEKDKVYEESLYSYVRERNLENRVDFIPHVDNVSDYMAALDIFFHSSTIPEPFGLVVSETMLCNTLVLGSDEGGVTDILKDGVTGFSFSSAQENAVDSLILKLRMSFSILGTKDEVLIKEEAYELISKKYSVSQMGERLENLYKAL